MWGHRRFLTLTTAVALVATGTVVVTAQAAPLSPPGQLWAWGNADEGVLGTGGRDCGDGETLICTPLETLLTDVTQVDGGDIHAVALTADGSVYNWGLGDMIADNVEGGVFAEPQLVDLPEVQFQAVAAGGQHTLALATDGTVWSWGNNGSGQLGHGFTSDREAPFVSTPSQVVAFSDNEPQPLEGIVAIAAGAAHSLALDVNGLVWGWGSDEFGQLGTGGFGGRPMAAFPVEAGGGGDDVFPPLGDVIEIAAGDNHSLAVDGGSRVYGWGDNSSGQLGTGEIGGTETRAVLQAGPFAVDIAGGAAHSLMRGKDGTVYAVGDGSSGQLGIGPADPIGTPEPIEGLQASHIAAHGDFSLAIQLGEVLAWGDGGSGQLGIGPADPRDRPNPVDGISNATGLGAGQEAGYAITELTVDPALSLTVQEASGASGPPGTAEIDLDDVDLATLPLFEGELASAPLRSSPLRSSPLRSSPVVDAPLRSSPLRSSPLRSSPLRSSPLRSSELDSTPLRSSPLRSSPLRSSPLRSSPLRSSPLSDMPLLLDGGWADVLVGTPFEGVALQTVRFGDVLDLEPSPLDGISMDFVDWTNSALKRASVVGFLFGGLEIGQFPGSGSWCATLSAAGFDCATNGIGASSTLLELDLAGAPLDVLDLSDVPIDQIAWAGGTNTPVYHYDLLFVDTAGTVIGELLISALPDGICGDIAGGFQCDTPGATLADAIGAGAIPGYGFGDTDPPILGRILADPSLVPGLTDPDPTIGDVLPMIIDPAKLDLDAVSLFRLLQGLPAEGDTISYEATAELDCGDIDDFTLRVTIPAGFRYVPDSARLDLDGAGQIVETIAEPPEATLPVELPADAPEPTPQPQPLTFGFQDAVACDEIVSSAIVQLGFDVLPYIELSEPANGASGFPSSAALFLGDEEAPAASVGDTARYVIDDPFPEGGRSIDAGSLHLGWLPPGKTSEEYTVTLDGSTELEPGTLVTAVLSHLPADFDLRVDGPASAPLRSSPLRSSPLRSSPLRSSPIEDEGLTNDPAGQQISSDDLQDIPTTEDTLSVSANRGLEPDVVSTVVTANTSGDPLTIEVSSYLGSSSRLPYSLQVHVEPPPVLNCATTASTRATAFAGGTAGTLPAVPVAGFDEAGSRTLVLYNQQRLEALYGADELTAVLASLAELEDDPEAEALLVPVDGDVDVRAAYAAWDADPCAPEAANDVVRTILAATDAYVEALPELRYITIVGNDDIIPSARIPDLVTLSNQRDYYPEVVFDSVDNPISAAQAMSYVTSDSAYTDLDPIDWLGHELLIPDLAGGRLVETPGEIVSAIDRYLDQPYVGTGSSLVTAYDFLVHGAEDTQATFEDLVGPGNAASRIDEDWSKDDVLALLEDGPDLVAVNAHYDHSRSLPAVGDKVPIPASELLTSSDLLSSGLSAGALFFTVGCNAGINVPALSGVGLPDDHERLLDFAQAMAQKQAGGFLGNAGFGYGDTELSAYSERLMSLFATYLDGSMTVGQASVAARKAYVAELGLLGVYDDKSLTEATLYGLPFMRVGTNGGSLRAEDVYDDFPTPPDTAPVATDPETGLEASAFDVTPFGSGIADARVEAGRGAYYQVEGHRPLAMHYRPIQPSMQLALPEPDPDRSIGDVLITGLSSVVVDPDIDAVFSRPTVDDSASEPEPIIRNLAFPSTIGTITPEASLVLLPGQYRGGDDPATGQQILHTSIQGEVLYPARSTTSADDGDRPFFARVEGVRRGGSVDFTVDVTDAQYVLVLYRRPAGPGGVSTWGSVELSPFGGDTWTGTVDDDVVEFFVQAVSVDGLVGSARGKGFDFLPLPGDTAGDDAGPVIDIAVPTSNQVFTVGEVVDAEFSCSDEGSGVASCQAQDPIRLDTSPGPHTFTVEASDNAGNTSTATVVYSAVYATDGFQDPVKDLPVVNEVTAGRTVPLKFQLRTHDGTVVSDLGAVVSLTSVVYACDSSDPAAPAEESLLESGKTSLRFSGDGFVYNWQTDKAWKTTCREVQVRTADGVIHRAKFRFK